MEQALAQAEEGAEEEPVRLFTSFDYQAKSWNHPQRILYKAEVTQGQANPRFVTTNIPDRTPKFLYEKVYCARGRAEGFIKNHKTFLHSDRTSCHRFAANQFRLFLHSAAYVLMHPPPADRPARHALGDGHLRHDPASPVKSRGARARAGDAHSFSLCDLVSPPGLVEDDHLQLGLQLSPRGRGKKSISRKTKGVLCSNPTTYRLKRGPAIRYRCKTWTRQAHEHGKGPGALKTSRASRST
jgi:hypothetical protein